jgi:hypothetical protein
MRLIHATPLAFLSSACALRPWTPSVSIDYWREDVASFRLIQRPTAEQAILRWQLPAASPWARYQKLTLLSSLGSVEGTFESPNVQTLEVVQRALLAASAIGQAGLPGDTLWIVDLRGAASVAFGAKLSETAKESVALVLTFNNWPAPVEFVPAEETLTALITMQPKLETDPDVVARPFFLLDAWRLAYRELAPDEAVTDNRYMLTPSDFPDATELASQGIKRVIYLVEDRDDTDAEEDDLQRTMLAYQHAGVSLHLVDLAWVTALGQSPRYDAELASQALQVRPRRTLVEDPEFFARARGGFGGSQLLPSPFWGHSRFHVVRGGRFWGGGFRGGGWGGRAG